MLAEQQLDLFTEHVAGATQIPPAEISEEPYEVNDEHDARYGTQEGLFGDLPGFTPTDSGPFKTIYVHFECYEDLRAFGELIGQTLSTSDRRLWFPPDAVLKGARWVDKPRGPR